MARLRRTWDNESSNAIATELSEPCSAPEAFLDPVCQVVVGNGPSVGVVVSPFRANHADFANHPSEDG